MIRTEESLIDNYTSNNKLLKALQFFATLYKMGKFQLSILPVTIIWKGNANISSFNKRRENIKMQIF